MPLAADSMALRPAVAASSDKVPRYMRELGAAALARPREGHVQQPAIAGDAMA